MKTLCKATNFAADACDDEEDGDNKNHESAIKSPCPIAGRNCRDKNSFNIHNTDSEENIYDVEMN